MIVLTLVNIGFVTTVITIWKKQRDNIANQQNLTERHAGFMLREIGFDEEQLNNFKQSRNELKEFIRPINMELRKLNNELIKEAVSDHPDTARCNQLSKLIGIRNGELRQAISAHLIQVSKSATPDQREELRKFYLDMFRAGPMDQRPGRQFRYRGGRNNN